MAVLGSKSALPGGVALTGCRVLALGPAMADLAAAAEGPLAGAAVTAGAVEGLDAASLAAFDLVLIDADAFEAPELAAAVKALSAAKSPPPVLMAGASLPAGLVRNLLRLEHADILEAPFSPDQLTAALAGLLASRSAHPASPAGASRCWAVTGAVGGSGATTVAVEIAHALSVREGNARVCLIDLNLADGAAAAYFGAAPGMGLADFGASAERIDQAMLQAFATPVSERLDLLAHSRDPQAFDNASREAVLRVLEIACETYDWVILDLPRHRRAWTLEALAGSDEVLVISELTVPALLAARALSDEIEDSLGTGLKPRIVLNRLASRMFGPAPSMAEAERALQRKALAGVSSDWEAAAASVNLGGPIAHHRPKSKIVKDIETLVEKLIAEAARRDVQGGLRGAA